MIKKHILSPIWILPLTALCIGAWLLFVTIRDAGVNITVHFASAEGIISGKTVVMYKGIPVGTVYDMRVDDDLQGVTLSINLKKRCGKALGKDTKFWIVKPEVSAGQVRGLDTILTGSYIRVQLGTSNITAKSFVGLDEAAGLPLEYPGLRITLLADELNSLQKGSHVYFKDIKIGQLEEYGLTSNNQVSVNIHIEEKYQHLIKERTRFWNVSGFSVDADIQKGVDLRIESLAALMYGGISCSTPLPPNDGEPVNNGTIFPLYADHESAAFGLPMTLELQDGMGIVAGKTKIMYHGIQLGAVKKLYSTAPNNFDTVSAEIILDPRAHSILREGTVFHLVRPSLSLQGIKNPDTLITGAYITFSPGTGPFCDHFTAGKYPLDNKNSGKSYIITSPRGYGLTPDSPVLYKDITVGKIKKSTLDQEGRKILTEIIIYEPYDHLVKINSIFWRHSTAHIKGDLSGVSVDIGPLNALFSGAVAFETPPGNQSSPAKEKSHFSLFNDLGAALRKIPILRPDCTIISLRSQDNATLSQGSPVLYKSLKIGEVVNVKIDQPTSDILFDIIIENDYRHLINNSSRFYHLPGLSVSASITGVEIEMDSLRSLVNGGIGVITPDNTNHNISDNKQFSLYSGLQEAQAEDALKITLSSEEVDAITEKMKIKYHGITIGKIIKADFAPGFHHTIGQAVVREDSRHLFRENTLIHLVKPRLGITAIENPETLVSGPYLEIIPGKGKIKTNFTISLSSTPHLSDQGLHITLVAPRLGHLRPSSPVYYRQVQIGEVTGYSLAPQGQSVLIELYIPKKFAEIIHSGSKFWLTSGIQITGGLFSEFQVSAESMESLLKGGVGVATPDDKHMGRSAINKDTFPLNPQVDPKWLNWSPSLPLTY